MGTANGSGSSLELTLETRVARDRPHNRSTSQGSIGTSHRYVRCSATTRSRSRCVKQTVLAMNVPLNGRCSALENQPAPGSPQDSTCHEPMPSPRTCRVATAAPCSTTEHSKMCCKRLLEGDSMVHALSDTEGSQFISSSTNRDEMPRKTHLENITPKRLSISGKIRKPKLGTRTPKLMSDLPKACSLVPNHMSRPVSGNISSITSRSANRSARTSRAPLGSCPSRHYQKKIILSTKQGEINSTTGTLQSESSVTLAQDDMTEISVGEGWMEKEFAFSDRRESELNVASGRCSMGDWIDPEMHISYCRRSWNERVQPGPSVATIQEGFDRAGTSAEDTALNPVLEERRERFLMNKELFLYPLVFLVAIFSLALLLMILTPRQGPLSISPKSLVRNTCSSVICLQDAAYLTGLLSWELDPCKDFYKYVCSRWTNRFPVLGKESTASFDDDYASNLEDRMYRLLQNKSHKSDIAQPLRSLFGKCVDVRRIEEAGWDPLLELMFHVSLDGFPLTPPIRKGISVWRMAARILRKTGAAALLSVGIVSHPWNASVDIASLGPPETLVSIAGVDINEAIRHYTAGAFSSLKVLRKEFIPPVYTLSIARFASDLEKLFQQKAGEFNFKAEKVNSSSPLYSFLDEVFSGIPRTIYNGPEYEILIYNPDFVFRLIELVRTTETHTVMNFLGVRLMVQTSALLPQSELVDVYSSLIYGKLRAAVPRWKLCLRVVENALSPLFHYSTLVHFNLHMSATKLSELVSDIVEEFFHGIDQAAYLNNASKIAIRHLITQTQFKVLGASWVSDKHLLDEYIRELPSHLSGKALDSYVLSFEHNFVSSLARSSSQRWSHTAFSTNCWFERHPRTVYVPMLLFNSTLALDNSTDSFQLSRTGIRVGRCIFEMLLTETGAIEPSEQWLNEETKSRLTKVLRCLGDKDIWQEMTRLPEASVTHFTFNHFQKVIKSSGEELRLNLAKNENFGARKLFFVYLALQSCEKGREKSDAHLPDRGAFLNDALRHERGFHDSFNCTAGSSMHPTHQCVI